MSTRRQFLRISLASLPVAGLGLGLGVGRAEAAPSVIVGGGPAGLSAALALRAARPHHPVTLIERDPRRITASGAHAPYERPGHAVDHAALIAAGVTVMLDEVTHIAWKAGRLALFSGRQIAFGQIVFAPGIAPRAEGIAGFDARARHAWPAAWGSATEARRLSARLDGLPDAAHVVLRLPAEAGVAPDVLAQRPLSLLRHLARHRPQARLTILDAQTRPDAAQTFHARARQDGLPLTRLDWRTADRGGTLRAVEAHASGGGVLHTDHGALTADMVNFIPAQQAAPIAQRAGLTDDTGWCPCDASGRSTRHSAAIVLGDARASARRSLADAWQSGRQLASVM